MILSTNLKSNSDLEDNKVFHFLFFVSFRVVISSNNVANTFSTSSLEVSFLTFHPIFESVDLNLLFQL
ncbi:hypothetical protein HOB94_07930 [bacterium]|nr:hypothetical protein [bacterium]MBT6779518.1 hypothetical protein [bacterium]